MAEKHTFRIQAMGELGIFEGDVFNGIALEGPHEAIRSLGRSFLEPVVVVPAGSHNKLVDALKAAKVAIEMMERPSGIGPEVAAALDARCAKIDAALASLDQESGQ